MGKDSKLHVVNVNDPCKKWSYDEPFKAEPTCLKMDFGNKRFFVGDNGGGIHVFKIKVCVFLFKEGCCCFYTACVFIDETVSVA